MNYIKVMLLPVILMVGSYLLQYDVDFFVALIIAGHRRYSYPNIWQPLMRQ